MRPPAPRFDPALTAPFSLGEGPACLLLHGFTGSPWELRPLGEALAARGFHAEAIRLPGHGRTAEAMWDGGFHFWRGAAEEALGRLKGPVCIAGLSMGALLAVDLATRFPERVRRLALLAPAFALRDPLASLLRRRPLRALPILELRPWIEKSSVDLADPQARRQAPLVPAFPSARLRDFWALQDLAWASLERVRAPTLIAIGGKDAVVDRRAIDRAARRLSRNAPVQHLVLPAAAHLLPRDFDHAHLEEEVARHFGG